MNNSYNHLFSFKTEIALQFKMCYGSAKNDSKTLKSITFEAQWNRNSNDKIQAFE